MKKQNILSALLLVVLVGCSTTIIDCVENIGHDVYYINRTNQDMTFYILDECAEKVCDSSLYIHIKNGDTLKSIITNYYSLDYNHFRYWVSYQGKEYCSDFLIKAMAKIGDKQVIYAREKTEFTRYITLPKTEFCISTPTVYSTDGDTSIFAKYIYTPYPGGRNPKFPRNCSSLEYIPRVYGAITYIFKPSDTLYYKKK